MLAVIIAIPVSFILGFIVASILSAASFMDSLEEEDENDE